MASRTNAPLATAFAAAALLCACTKAPEGWSADDKGKTRDLCLTQVGTGVELEQARAYCDCLVAKTVEQYPSHADAERLGIDRDGERLGNACAAELGLDGGAADSAAGADAAGSAQGQTPSGPRVYGDWQVEFVARGPDADDVDTWQAIGVDEHGAGARLAYICDASGYCGFVFRPATECDPSDAEPALFVLRFTLANGGAAVSTGGRCLRNGAWAFTAADEILDRFRAYPEAVKVGLRGDGWDFSLDGATAAMAYCERAARGERGADGGATPEPAAPPAR
jgi:hypothetical protein